MMLAATAVAQTSPKIVSQELIVRLREEAFDCTNCSANQQRRARVPPKSPILERMEWHGIETMEPVFGDVQAMARRQRTRSRFGKTQRGTGPDLDRIFRLRVAGEIGVQRVAEDLQRDPAVEWVEPNYLYHSNGQQTSPQSLPDDPFLNAQGSWGQEFPDLWGLFQIDAPGAWSRTEGEGVIVAVIDSGIDIEHPDLRENVWHNEDEVPGNGIDDDGNGLIDDVYGWDFTTCLDLSTGACERKERGPQITDPVGHGTHVAGTIAAVGNNGLGIIGVAPRARVMAVKGLDRSGFGTNQDLAEAVVYAAQNGARVINASWSGPPSNTIRTAIEYVANVFDVVVVASVDNRGVPLERGLYPANLSQVIAVGATMQTDEHPAFSNFGGPLDLVAPGGGDTGSSAVVRPDRSILSLLSQDARERDGWAASCREECSRCYCGSLRIGQAEECPANLCIQGDDVCVEGRCGFACFQCQDGEPFPPFSGALCPCEENSCAEYRDLCEPAPYVLEYDYVRTAGTSMAAAYVSGVAALVRGAHPAFTRRQVRQTLIQTVDDLGSAGWDPEFGYGRVNAARAIGIEDIPVAEIVTPENRTKVLQSSFPMAVKGSALSSEESLRNWELRIRHVEGGPEVVLATGTGIVMDGVLGTVGADRVKPGERYILSLSVIDENGTEAIDTKLFLVPNPRYGLVPVPDRFDEGSQEETVSADGKRLLMARVGRDSHECGLWLLDVRTRQLIFIADRAGGYLSPDGRSAVFNEILSSPEAGRSSRTVLYDIEDGSSIVLPTIVGAGPLASHAARMAFLTDADFEDRNPDWSLEAYFFDLPAGPLRQITDGRGGRGTGVDLHRFAMSADGRTFLFTSQSDFDPLNSTAGLTQVFLYDDQSGRTSQLTGRNGFPPVGFFPAMSADGSKVVFEYSGVHLIDVATDSTAEVLPSAVLAGPAQPRLSGDGKMLAFVGVADLDPAVGNEDLRPEVFLLDVASGQISQVTDTGAALAGPHGLAAIDFSGGTIIVKLGGPLSSSGLSPLAVRAVLRKPTNSRPEIIAPARIAIGEGQRSSTFLHAVDPDGDLLTFYAERIPPFTLGVDPMRLRDLAKSELIDHGDGTAELVFTPGYREAGEYPLRLAVFDEQGDVDVVESRLVVEDCLHEGDANCDGQISEEDLSAIVSELFRGRSSPKCVTVDANGDGQVTAADLVWLLRNGLS